MLSLSPYSQVHKRPLGAGRLWYTVEDLFIESTIRGQAAAKVAELVPYVDPDGVDTVMLESDLVNWCSEAADTWLPSFVSLTVRPMVLVAGSWRAVCRTLSSIFAIHTHTPLHSYTYTYTPTHTPTHLHIHLHTYTYTYTPTHTPTHLHIHLHTYTYTYTPTHTHTHLHIHIHARTHTHTHIYTHTYRALHGLALRIWVAGPLLTISATKIKSAAASPRLPDQAAHLCMVTGALPSLFQSCGTVYRAKSGKLPAWAPSRKPSKPTSSDFLAATS